MLITPRLACQEAKREEVCRDAESTLGAQGLSMPNLLAAGPPPTDETHLELRLSGEDDLVHRVGNDCAVYEVDW